LDRLKKFYQSKKLKKAALTYLASRAEDVDVAEEMKMFFELDKNRDGYITRKELKEGVKHLDEQEGFDDIFEGVDVDHNGAINYTEFIAATLDQTRYVTEPRRMQDVFKVFDKDGDGHIDSEEIRHALSCKDDEALIKIINECDRNGDGKINFEEFQELMTT
jgi:Ca2+-binding EF-hand superfamily protein